MLKKNIELIFFKKNKFCDKSINSIRLETYPLGNLSLGELVFCKLAFGKLILR